MPGETALSTLAKRRELSLRLAMIMSPGLREMLSAGPASRARECKGWQGDSRRSKQTSVAGGGWIGDEVMRREKGEGRRERREEDEEDKEQEQEQEEEEEEEEEEGAEWICARQRGSLHEIASWEERAPLHSKIVFKAGVRCRVHGAREGHIP